MNIEQINEQTKSKSKSKRGRKKGTGDPSAPFRHTMKDLELGLLTIEQYRIEQNIYQQWYRDKNPQTEYQKQYRKARKQKFKVYKLVYNGPIYNGPVEEEVMYIGRTQSDLELRMQQHCAQFKFDVKEDFRSTSILAYRKFYDRGLDICDFEIILVSEFETLKESQAAEKACQKLLKL